MMAILHIGKDDFELEVLKSSRTVLVDFWATWCGPCRMLAPVLEELANEHPEVKVCKIDVDEEPTLAMKYGVMSIPMLVVFKNGEVVNQTVGLQPKAALEKLIG